MKTKVHTYDDPKSWRQHSQFENIKKAIHICATKNMAEGIEEAYRDDVEGEFQSIFTIREVIDSLLIRWNTPEEQLKQYLSLSKVIAESNPANPLLKEAFKNNISDILETIRLLAYTDVKPIDLLRICQTDKEKYFCDIWSEAEKATQSYSAIRKVLSKGWHANDFMDKFIEIKNEKNKKRRIKSSIDKKCKMIVLHGFYFITPEQQVFLRKMVDADFELIFFNFYDQRFPETFDFTRAFISGQFNWTDEWIIESNRQIMNDTMGATFLSAFEGREIQKENYREKIIKYDSFYEFLNQVIIPSYPIGQEGSGEDKVQIIATNADILNEILVQYYPDKFAEKRSFLQYPIGQFLSKIHGMMDGERFILNEDILFSTFSSGWLYNPINKKNARDYTYTLKQLLPFFYGCDDALSWKKRFKELIEIYDDVLANFEEPGDDRVITSVRSPFSKIAHFSFPKSLVEDVIYFIDQLIFIAEELFDSGERETTITRHFTKLLNILQKHNPIKHSFLVDEEVKVIDELSSKLKSIKDENFFLYDDISEALNLYLGGKLSNGDDSFIKPFIEVDGESFKKNVKSFYLTGLDEEGLPLGEFSTPWPLQETTFEKLSLRYEVLELSILRNKSVKHISRYLLFIALEFLKGEKVNLQLSWMANFLDRKDLKPAIYIYQLGLKILSSRESEEEKITDVSVQNPFNSSCLSLGNTEEYLQELSFMDYIIEFNQCQRRFYYSYVTSEHPVFDDDFIHQFLFTELVRIVKRSTGNKLHDDEIIEVVGKLFPQWTRFKKEAIARKYTKWVSDVNHDQINEKVSISSSRIALQFPGLRAKIRETLVKNTMNKKSTLQEMMREILQDEEKRLKATPGEHCKFCPHQNICADAK